MAKRQLSLFETKQPLVKSSSPVASTSDSSKRIKLSSSGPFSQQSFIDSLSDAPPRSSSSGITGSNAIKGDATIEELSERELLKLECETMELSWLKVLGSEMRKPYFIKLKKFLWKEGLRGVDWKQNVVFPPAKDVYSWSRYTPLDKVKVIIIGQDPYHDDSQAHGLSFSVPRGVKIPPSLRNIHQNLRLSYPDTFPKFAPHGSLIASARSGVLWLNTSLTVGAHKAGSHKGHWEEFTDKVLKEAVRESKGVVVMAWGAWAQKRAASLDKKKHLILSSVHPSPLSAHRGFLTNGHFVQANEWLEKKYGSDAKIDWTKLDYEDDISVIAPAAEIVAAVADTEVGGEASAGV